MPHSSGGGSHGGGFHGSSHGGSSGRSYSTHYFPGARRFRYRDEKGNDRYVYSTVKPQKPSMFGVIAPLVFGGFMGLMILPTLFASAPKKLTEDYPEPDAYVYDNIGVIADEDALTDELEEFRDITGICPVIYTVDDDDWQYDFSRLESYAMDLYTDNYDDEQHFVIVYSIDSEHIEDNDFAWEAIQGDETDPIITESFFEDFGESLQEEFEDEQEVGEAFTKAFRAATKRAEDRINPSSSRRIA
nr:TPM domain-containing protein [Saccharofermentans sp.]